MLEAIPYSVYAEAVAWTAEYIGTTFFLLLALAGQQTAFAYLGPRAGVEGLLYASASYGLAFAVSCWAFFRVTSGLFNPAITLSMCLNGSLEWLRGVTIMLAQFLGAMTAAGIVDGLLPGPLAPQLSLGDSTSVARGFFIELLLTACLIFIIFMLTSERHKGITLTPIGLGLAMFVVELSGIAFTGCSLNPARAFAVAIAAHHFPGYHWIYWLGPALGSVLAVGLYRLNRTLEHEMAFANRRAAEDTTAKGAEANKSHTDRSRPHVLSAVPEDDAEKGEVVGV